MKRIALPLAATVMAAILVSNLDAKEAATISKDAAAAKMVTPDWHYRWHEGRWWYWMPESGQWMVWVDSAWVPFAQFAKTPRAFHVSQAAPDSTSAGSGAVQSASISPQPESTSSNDCPPTYSSGSTGNYAGYGWSWGPGTAYRDGPGRRF